MKRAITHPRFWIRYWRVRRALIGYPLYDVPHKGEEARLPEQAVQDNFAYFMKVKDARLLAFMAWLKASFRISASLTPDGVVAVAKWVDDYGGGVANDQFTAKAFASYQPRWGGPLVGYNLMIDLGIFLGEYAILRRPRLCWEIYRGHEVEPMTFKSMGFQRPTIGGMPMGWKRDVLTSGYGIIKDARKASYLDDTTFYQKNKVVMHLRSLLYAARMPEDLRFIGDSTNEPL